MDSPTNEAAAELLQTYTEGGGINYLDAAANLPSRPAIEEACVDLMSLMFPGFHGEPFVDSSDLPDVTRSRIRRLHARMKPEISKSFNQLDRDPANGASALRKKSAAHSAAHDGVGPHAHRDRHSSRRKDRPAFFHRSRDRSRRRRDLQHWGAGKVVSRGDAGRAQFSKGRARQNQEGRETPSDLGGRRYDLSELDCPRWRDRDRRAKHDRRKRFPDPKRAAGFAGLL